MSEVHISQAFWQYQARQIMALYEPMVNFCLKWVVNYFFMYVLRGSNMQPHGSNCSRAEEYGEKKNLRFLLLFNFCFRS
jgi:hypothetical protein